MRSKTEIIPAPMQGSHSPDSFRYNEWSFPSLAAISPSGQRTHVARTAAPFSAALRWLVLQRLLHVLSDLRRRSLGLDQEVNVIRHHHEGDKTESARTRSPSRMVPA